MRTEEIIISFVIPAFNEEEYIAQCINSIRKQRTDVLYEIIVVDNASSDKTASIAKNLGVKVVLQQKKGLCFARQSGLDAARGKYLVYIDADTRLPNDFTKNIFAYFQTHTDVVAASCNLLFYDGRFIENIVTKLYHFFVLPLTNFVLRLLGKPDFLFGSMLAIRTDALRKAGINKDFIFLGEDIILAYQLQSEGKVRLLQNMYVYTSARRYQSEGAVKTWAYYLVIFILINGGFYNLAKKFSRQAGYSSSSVKKHRLLPHIQ